MTIREALAYDNKVETDLLLGHVLKKSKEFLLLNPEKKLTAIQEKKFKAAARARQKGMPAAYILGYKYFYGLKFLVNKDVLIPRPESEWLVERAISEIKTNHSPNILDVGTGSGIIAISISKKLPKASVTATDISANALVVAKRNNKLHKSKVKFIKSNLFSSVTGKFDLITANLPYVPLNDYKKLLPNLKYEPKLALTDGTNNSALIQKFITQAKIYLSIDAVILMEIDPSSKPFIIAIAKRSGLAPKFYKDFRGLIRYVILQPLR